MNNEDFYSDSYQDNDEGQDLSYALEAYKQACEAGTESSLLLSEEEFLYIIEYYISNIDEENVLKASEIAFQRHAYSSDLLVKLADSLILMGKVDRAVEILDEYKNSFLHNADILFLYCRAHINKRDFATARNYFDQIMQTEFKNRNTAESAASLAQDCVDIDNFKEALYYYLESDKIHPLIHDYYSGLAYCYEKLEELDNAILYYNKYIDEDPFNDNVWFNLGTIYAKQRNFEKAVEAIEYSIALNDTNASALYNLAVVFLNMERYQEAALHFTRFNEMEQDNLAGVIGLADARLGQNDFKGARLSFYQALDINGQCEEAMLGLKCIEAIGEYLRGEKYKFLSQMSDIAKKDFTWVNTVYTILPQLSSDGDFMNFLKTVKKPE